ncbi:hypothetical protein CASFOL_024575 [Castilleja foliolosa]|uniref:FAD-binding PCMH-type domain-containing protein n=1 Tax=Castilleja foliolosa TaxID=1961234 RepID=A0ABD3CQI2_9LAMI
MFHILNLQIKLTPKIMASHILHLLLLLLSISLANCIQARTLVKHFAHCMSTKHINISKQIHTPNSPSYSTLLQSAQQNLRWINSSKTLKPILIVTPSIAYHVQAAIVCSKIHAVQIRVKSGGHDYEGLSYLCKTPFVIIDLVNLNSITIDLQQETAWVEAGATLGELYYSIAKKSPTLGFPGGLCPSVGVGGHFSGGGFGRGGHGSGRPGRPVPARLSGTGNFPSRLSIGTGPGQVCGFGTLLRKHGLAADNVVDAYFIDVNGNILNRESMGEDLFWAIRGGGGASFGIILAWKIKLVQVPPVVTVFTIHKNLDREGIKTVHKWQHVASKLPDDIFIRIIIQHYDERQTMVDAIFNSLFLGKTSDLLPVVSNYFPGLGLLEKDCTEMSWIESVLYFGGFKRDDAWEVLLARTVQYKSYFKGKSDFVENPMPESALEGIRDRLLEKTSVFLIMDPFGGAMDRVPEDDIPFPHRKGNLFSIQYLVQWRADGDEETRKHVEWIERVYEFMKPHVSRSPRRAYLNYRDLDLGVNVKDNTSYEEAMVWGRKYFKGNLERLAKVKKQVDPGNFFRNEQSIPLLS